MLVPIAMEYALDKPARMRGTYQNFGVFIHHDTYLPQGIAFYRKIGFSNLFDVSIILPDRNVETSPSIFAFNDTSKLRYLLDTYKSKLWS